MYARAVDDAVSRLRELRDEERGALGLAALALGLALAATQLRPELAVPLLAGAMGVGVLGVRAYWCHWDLVERLAAERDAHVIPEVRDRAEREATIDRRRTLASYVRIQLKEPVTPRVRLAFDDLVALASELDDDGLALDPTAAMACTRLLSDPGDSPLLDATRPPEELRSRVRQIRSGFEPRRRVA